MPTPNEHTNPEQDPKQPNRPEGAGPLPDLSKEQMGAGDSSRAPQDEPDKGATGSTGSSGRQSDARPERGNESPDNQQEGSPMAGRAKRDVFTPLEKKLRTEYIRSFMAPVVKGARDIEIVRQSIDRWLAPPIDEEARDLVRLAARRQIPEDAADAIRRLSDYYPEWEEAFHEHDEQWAEEDFTGDGENRLKEFTIPQKYLDAIEAGDRVRLDYEREVAPPVDARAREQLRKYVAGELPAEVGDRLDNNIERFLSWELALKVELNRQGKTWDELGRKSNS